MIHELPILPWARSSLAPIISEETINVHYGKHHQTYVTNLNKLIPGTEFADMSLEQIIVKSSGGVFNNAAQVWNHTFYWHCMAPDAGGTPSGPLLTAINAAFGSLGEFKQKFAAASAAQFGSGWGWLVKDQSGQLTIETTSNAQNPMTSGKRPLLTVDVWEHAYYIDYRNVRVDYLEKFWQVVNWKFVEKNYSS